MRRAISFLAGAALLAACTSEDPGPTIEPSPTAVLSSSPSATVEPTASPSPIPSPSPEPTPAVTVDAPDRPYDAATILDAMRDSRRPDGVPAQLQTLEVAGALADRIWTIGGEPWEAIAIGASCGFDSCLVEIAGTPRGAAGEDLYVFDVDVASGSYDLVDATLLGLGPDTVTALDRFARERTSVELDGFALASARWLPPPDDGQFVLAYRSGGEEGSPRVDLLVDVEAGTVTPLPEARVRGRASG